MLKKFFSVMLLAVAILLIPSQTQAYSDSWEAVRLRGGPTYQCVVVKCKEWISLRAEPSVYSQRLEKIPLGTKIEVYDAGSENGFVAANYAGRFGFVLEEYLKYVPGSGGAPW